MTPQVPFGRQMREAHFGFAPLFTPFNHGSYGATPLIVEQRQREIQKREIERPDPFIIYDLPNLINESCKAVAPLLGAAVEEVVFVPNASTGVNTVLRNLKFEEKDVIVYFSTIYDACERAIDSISALTPLIARSIPLRYPIEDDEIVQKLRAMVQQVRDEGFNVKIAMFDTVLTFPGVPMPWEALTKACKELGVLSLLDGAHGIGHVDLKHLGSVSPDFFVSNCHKWLYTPRGCAVFYVPFRNQHLIRTSLPTSWRYRDDEAPDWSGKSRFVMIFEFVATMDHSPYCCVPAAIQFRKTVCGGEGEILKYCWNLAARGGQRVADILGTEIMANKSGSLAKCCFSTIKLPIVLRDGEGALVKGEFHSGDASKIKSWLNKTAYKEFDTYLQIDSHAGAMWVRLSAQIYLELQDYEWLGPKLKELCQRLVE